jgi:hypothetical protein
MLAILGLSFFKKSFGQFSAPPFPCHQMAKICQKQKLLSQPLVLEKFRVYCPNPKSLNIWRISGIYFF